MQFGALTISFNGEIYNYLELRDRLAGLGHRFETRSDTEVLLHAFAQWGHGALSELNGMFAFAIWDDVEGTLFCARDRFGEKPFYYAWADGAFAFASEAKALALLAGVDLGINAAVLSGYVANGSTDLDAHEETLIRGIRQLPPGHSFAISVNEGGLHQSVPRPYFMVDVDGRHSYGADDLPAAGAHLLRILTDSTRLRLRSDVRVGSCLSGGLDSSAIVCLMRRLEADASLSTFTGRFPGDPMDEGRYANLVVAASHTDHHEVMPTPERFLSEAPRVYWHADFPIGGMSQFAQYCVFGLARQNDVTVLLDGQGSDEQLGGYGNAITRTFLIELLRRRKLRAFMAERRVAARTNASFSWAKLALHETPARRFVGMLRKHSGRSTMSRASLYRADALASAPALDSIGEDHSEESLSGALWRLSFRTMLSSLLRFGDRLSMSHSLEVRLPFCDHRLTEFVYALSPELLVGNGEVKRVLRTAIDGLVPREIVTRRKQGFQPPQNAWLTGPLRSWVVELSNEPGPLGEFLNRDVISKLAGGDLAARLREVTTLWEAANLLAWSRYALAEFRRLPKHPPIH